MRALPVTYMGVTFRSRLEADWAANLDARGLPWEYEPEGYELDDGTWYSPDFWLPTAQAWLEVKGAHNLGLDKTERFAAELWLHSPATDTYDSRAPMVLLGREARYTDAPPMRSWPNHTINLTGIMGPGKGYSVAVCACPGGHRTVVSLWQPACRHCGSSLGFGYDGQPEVTGPGSPRWSVYDSWSDPFTRLPRPAGRGAR